MKTINGYEFIQMFEEFSPKKHALEGDPIGLHVGTLNKKIKKVMIALDVMQDVVDEAIEKDVDLIIAHHPLIYRPLKNISTEDPTGKLIEQLIKHDIAVYAAHTNLDVSSGGVNDMLAVALKLEDTTVLVPTYSETLKKLVVFVPEEDEEQMLQALGHAGAGAIGEYTECSFSSIGTGRFLPGGNTNPHIGKRGKLEWVKEVKIETVYPEHIEKKVIAAMLKAHPYEEPAYDLYSLDLQSEQLGLGRVGELSEEMNLQAFAEYVKVALDSGGVRVIGDLNSRVKKVAILGGDGNKYISAAKFKGADAYVTGDIYYHTAHDAMNMGLNIVDPGHNVEKIMKKGLTNILQEMSEKRNYEVKIFASEINTDPYIFL
ncbi:Nif3-like dinuclear metal center hexameric protein [Bacillus sp. FSL K6-3431]|uniref:Nif3-like dinuclear metal center hexameric protein n=1 Tax=Bacillus sp. FSL K6-3431 TaxID=2921500 RepID=UPI0030F9DA17